MRDYKEAHTQHTPTTCSYQEKHCFMSVRFLLFHNTALIPSQKNTIKNRAMMEDKDFQHKPAHDSYSQSSRNKKKRKKQKRMGRKMTDKKTHDPIYSCKLKGFKDKTKPFKTERCTGPLWQHKDKNE